VKLKIKDMIMSKKIGILLIVIFAINLAIGIVTSNLAAICGWLCALIAQIQLLYNFGDN
jgi:hypothetical protein